MTQPSENKDLSIQYILEILRSEAESMPPSPTSSRYLRALQSLQSSAPSAPHTPPRLNTATPYSTLHTLLTDWLVNQWLLSVPFTTASLYLDIISALYTAAVKAEKLPKTTLFSQLKARLKTLGPEGWKSGIDEEIFTRALRLTKNAHRLISDDAIAVDLILLSLNSGLQPLESLALLPRDPESHPKAAEEQSPQNIIDPAFFASLRSLREEPLVHQIIARHAPNARRKYIFSLNQSQRTEAQLKRHISKIVNALFRRARLPQATDPNQTVEALWAYAALRTGIPASQVVAYLGHAPLGLPALKLSSFSSYSSLSSRIVDNADNFDNADNEKYFSQIGKVFLDNPPRWYAMSLRPGVRFTQVCRRIEILSKFQTARSTDTATPELFYPCEEIARAIGKKIVIKERPFIHSVVFFKAKLTDIGPLFAKIGDLAWCYRQSAVPGAPYAEISDRQFRLFQQTIARFTPDYEVAPTGELELHPNDRVEILGGLFAGQTATVDSVAVERRASSRREPSKGNSPHTASADIPYCETDTPSTVYRLNIVGDNGIEWRISVDSRLAKKTPT